MKTKIRIILALLLISCNSNDNGFTITGLTSSIPDRTRIYLTDPSVSEILDSSLVIQNQFQFKGDVDSEGKIIGIDIRGELLEARLDSMFKKELHLDEKVSSAP